MASERCDIILPTLGGIELLKDCIESLIRCTKYPYRLIVIDNGVSQEAAKYLESVAKSGRVAMELIKPSENLGWIRSINAGLELAEDSKYLCFQNDDTIFTEGWLEELVKVFESDTEIGIANPEWEKPENISVDDYAFKLRERKDETIDTDWCRGHCFFVRREVVDKIGGLDTAYLPGYYDDRDYSLKAIAAGYRCVIARRSFVYHIRNATMKKTMEKAKVEAIMEKNGRTFYKRWGLPLRLIFVLNNVKDSQELLRSMCIDQNKVIVIKRGSSKMPYAHTNMKVIDLAPIFSTIQALAYIMTKRSKKDQKAIDFIFTDDKSFDTGARILKALLPAEVSFDADISKLGAVAARLVKTRKEI